MPQDLIILWVVIFAVWCIWVLDGGLEKLLDALEVDPEHRRALRMARNRGFIERCEKLTGKKFETYAEAAEAWDAAGYFLPWRRWRDGRRAQ